MPDPVEIYIPFELRNLNEGRGSHWGTRVNYRKLAERILRTMGKIPDEPIQGPVRLTITRVLGPRQRLWDADSVLRGNAKELIDALVAVGWLVGDGPRVVTEAIGQQDATRRDEGPATHILIEPIT